MDLPFTTEQFLDIFSEYNTAIWPGQVIAYMAGFAVVVLAFRKESGVGKIPFLVLGLFWIWMGAVYHLLFFSAINTAALLFGGLFMIQGVLFLVPGFTKQVSQFGYNSDAYGIVGLIFILYAVLIYPILGALSGHGYPYSPVFGVAPCPTTIFTFGILLWMKGRVPGWLLTIPIIWSFIGFMAALQLGIREDIGLLAAGVIGASMILYRNRQRTYKLVKT